MIPGTHHCGAWGTPIPQPQPPGCRCYRIANNPFWGIDRSVAFDRSLRPAVSDVFAAGWRKWGGPK